MLFSFWILPQRLQPGWPAAYYNIMTEASSTEKKQQMAGKMRVRKHHSDTVVV